MLNKPTSGPGLLRLKNQSIFRWTFLIARLRNLSYIRPCVPVKEKRFTAILIAMNPYLFGAGEMNRTPDLLITNELLYRLSYTGFIFYFSFKL